MPLKLILGPRERAIVGNSLIQNGGAKCVLLVENRVPVLRGKHVMTEMAADTPCRKIYFSIQVLYLEDAPNQELERHTIAQIDAVAKAAPSLIPVLSGICDKLARRSVYAALLLAQELIRREETILKRKRPVENSVPPPA